MTLRCPLCGRFLVEIELTTCVVRVPCQKCGAIVRVRIPDDGPVVLECTQRAVVVVHDTLTI